MWQQQQCRSSLTCVCAALQLQEAASSSCQALSQSLLIAIASHLNAGCQPQHTTADTACLSQHLPKHNMCYCCNNHNSVISVVISAGALMASSQSQGQCSVGAARHPSCASIPRLLQQCYCHFPFCRGFEGFTTVPGPVHGWRCRAKLAVRGSAAAPQLGLFQANSHDLVPIPECR
jgi:hypothetical protein